MTELFHSHDAIAWAKQRLDELDAIILEVEKTAGEQRDAASADVESALARLRSARAVFQSQYDALRADADSLKQQAESAQHKLDEEWVGVEQALQSFQSAAVNQAEVMRDLVIARADVQRRSFEAFLEGFRARAEDALDRARDDFAQVTQRIGDEAENVQAKIANVKNAGDESWAAVKEGLTEVKKTQEQTFEKIRTSLSRMF